jgi:hypothetical protein
MGTDFKSHLPVQTHMDGDSFTPSSDFAVAIGGYESVSGTFLGAGITAARELLVSASFTIAVAEDAVAASGDKGIIAMAVRQDALVSSTSADGDYATLKVNAVGELYTHDADVLTELGTINTSLGTINTSIGSTNTKLDTIITDLGTINTSVGAVTTAITDISKAEDSAHVSGDKGIMALAVRQDTASVTLAGTDGDYIPLSVDKYGSLRVTVTDPTVSATDVVEYKTNVVASGAVQNHDYTVTALKTLKTEFLLFSGSGRISVEVTIDPAGTPKTIMTVFNSTANANIYLPLAGLLEVAAGKVIRFAIKNEDQKSQSVYSTLFGYEV